MKKDCQIYFLEMHQEPTFDQSSYSLCLEECQKPMTADFFLEIYKKVGQDYQWMDRLVYSTNELEEIINQDKTHIYLIKSKGVAIGFTELTVEKEHVEILFFGLFPDAIGKGWGKQSLEMVIKQAWSFATPKVQLNTCDWDHPRALSNYLKAGFKEVRRVMKNQ